MLNRQVKIDQYSYVYRSATDVLVDFGNGNYVSGNPKEIFIYGVAPQSLKEFMFLEFYCNHLLLTKYSDNSNQDIQKVLDYVKFDNLSLSEKYAKNEISTLEKAGSEKMSERDALLHSIAALIKKIAYFTPKDSSNADYLRREATEAIKPGYLSLFIADLAAYSQLHKDSKLDSVTSMDSKHANQFPKIFSRYENLIQGAIALSEVKKDNNLEHIPNTHAFNSDFFVDLSKEKIKACIDKGKDIIKQQKVKCISFTQQVLESPGGLYALGAGLLKLDMIDTRYNYQRSLEGFTNLRYARLALEQGLVNTQEAADLFYLWIRKIFEKNEYGLQILQEKLMPLMPSMVADEKGEQHPDENELCLQNFYPDALQLLVSANGLAILREKLLPEDQLKALMNKFPQDLPQQITFYFTDEGLAELRKKKIRNSLVSQGELPPAFVAESPVVPTKTPDDKSQHNDVILPPPPFHDVEPQMMFQPFVMMPLSAPLAGVALVPSAQLVSAKPLVVEVVPVVSAQVVSAKSSPVSVQLFPAAQSSAVVSPNTSTLIEDSAEAKDLLISLKQCLEALKRKYDDKKDEAKSKYVAATLNEINVHSKTAILNSLSGLTKNLFAKGFFKNSHGAKAILNWLANNRGKIESQWNCVFDMTDTQISFPRLARAVWGAKKP
jgi:hypothetical protein